jgi:hypothetical protein
MLKRANLIPYMVCAAIICSFAGRQITWLLGRWEVEPNRLATQFVFVPGTTPIAHGLILVGVVLFCLAGLMALAKKRHPLSLLGWVAVQTMLIAAALWTLYSFVTLGVNQTVLMSGSPLLWVLAIGAFAGTEPDTIRVLSRFSIVAAVVMLLLTLYYISRFHLGAHLIGASPFIYSLVDTFWFTAFAVMLSERLRTPLFIFGVAMLAILTLLCIVALARGWLVQSLLLLLLTIARFYYSKRHVTMRTMLLTGITMVVSVALLSFIAHFFMQQQTDVAFQFMNKLSQDNRSGQYQAFFAQVPWYHLIFGGGPEATYAYLGESRYRFIDNQFVFILFHYGLPVLLGYLALTVVPGYRLLQARMHWMLKGGGVLLLLWALALAGLSTFNSLAWDPKNMVMYVTGGYCLELLYRVRWRDRHGAVASLPVTSP